MGLDLKGLFTGGISKLMDSAKGIISQFVADPVQKAAAIQALENEANRHSEVLIKEASELEQAYIKDMGDARNREIQIATSEKAPLINKIITPVLALLILGSTFLMWYIILFKDVPKEKEAIISGIIGSLTTLSMGVVQYFFGSSMGSKAKQEQLEKISNR